uniref:Chemokine interleukin-8-like domain-containing protein n=1 Tax=Coturnix japonica TaxID=93934 RepID=A0A8C2SP45_COTJA
GQQGDKARVPRDQPAALTMTALPAAGAPPAGELRCRCVRAVAERIPPRHLVQVELIPEGPHCEVPEIIATTKQGKHCLQFGHCEAPLLSFVLVFCPESLAFGL